MEMAKKPTETGKTEDNLFIKNRRKSKMMTFISHSNVIYFMHKLDLMLIKVANHSLNPDHILAQLCSWQKTTKTRIILFHSTTA
jgi:hypothetical protein